MCTVYGGLKELYFFLRAVLFHGLSSRFFRTGVGVDNTALLRFLYSSFLCAWGICTCRVGIRFQYAFS